jgi:hypothetical protein
MGMAAVVMAVSGYAPPMCRPNILLFRYLATIAPLWLVGQPARKW